MTVAELRAELQYIAGAFHRFVRGRAPAPELVVR
jgi:hypothetical protein